MKPLATLKSTAVAFVALLAGVLLGAAPAAAQQAPTVGIDAQEATAGSAVDVPVQVSDFNDVGSLRFVINYDDQAISFPSDPDASDLISGAPRSNFNANVPEPGTLIIQWFDGSGGDNPINLGTGTLLNLTFSNFAGGSTTITFADESNVQDASGNELGASFSGGVVAEDLASVTIGDVQDAGLNQTATVALSGQGLDNVGSVSLKVAFDADVLQFEGATNNAGIGGFNADASDGVVTISGFNTDGVSLGSDFVELDFTFLGGSSDVQVLSAQSEFTDPQSSPIPTEFSAGTVSGDEPTISVPDQSASTGETITVPVNASELQAIGSVTIDVTFNSASLTFSGDQNRLQGFDDLQIQEQEPGLVRITGFSTSGVDPADNNGRIVDLEFSVSSSLTDGDQTSIGFDAASEILSPSSVPYNMTFNGGRVVVEQTKIGLSDQSLTYDVTTVDSTSSTTLTITNTSSNVATLSGSVSLESDTFSVASGSGDFTLDPSQTRTVTIDYTPTEVANPDRDTLTITHNADNAASPLEVPLEGTAEAPELAVSPQSLTYKTTTIDSTSSQTFTVTNGASQTATLTGSIALVSDTFAVSSGGGDFELGPGESTDVTVDYGPTMVSNPDRDTVQISTNAGSASVPLEGTAEAPQIAAQLDPDTASVRSGEELTLTQTVSNGATQVAALDVQITSIPDFLTLEGAVITAGSGTLNGQQLTLQPGAEAEISYTFQEDVSETTTFSGAISHETNDPAAPTVDLPVEITATAAQIALSANSLTYGTVAVGTDSTRTLQVRNTNGASLTVDSVRTETDTFAVGSAAAGGFTVASGDSQSVSVTYAPQSASPSNTDTLEIYHQGDNAASPLEVPLEGSAELLSISEARGQGVGATVAVEGTVTRAFGSYVRIQDGSGATGASGLVIRQTDDSSFQGDIGASITKGTQLRVTGTLSAFNGLLQINNQDLASYAVQGQGSAPSAQDVELQTLSASGEDYESELVTVDSVRFVNPDTTGGTLDERTTYRIEGPGGVTFQYRVQSAAQTDVIGAPINPGMFTYTGVVGEFRGTYQFIPIRTSTGLPVELTSFEGTSVKRDGESAVQLTWRTTSETNNAGFRVQRKQVGAESGWKTVGRREGAGTTSEAQTYRFTDGDLPYAADTLTYRLRQVDVDGTTHFSDPVKIARSGPEGIELLGTAPNPARSRAVVRFAIPEDVGEEARLALYDVMGRKVRSMRVSAEAGRHKKSIDVSGLASGMYLLRLSAKDASPKTQKVTVVR